MKKIGFIGLGYLGKTIAGRLISQGEELVIWNRTIEKGRGMAAELADCPKQVAQRSNVIFLNLFDSVAVRAVLTGDGGLLDGDIAGKLVIDTTTNHFSDVLGFHELCSKKGCRYLEAPVLGSVVPAS